jgi:6-phosphogluconate dehydrogenase
VILSEAYLILKDVIGQFRDEMADVSEEWNKGELDCFLMETSRVILRS